MNNRFSTLISKMKATSLFSFLKQKGHIVLSFSGVGCLMLALVLVASFGSESDRKYDELMQHVSAIRNERGLVDSEYKNEGFQGKQRKKRSDIETGNSTSRSKGGAVYIRWGRTTCSENVTGTELVYNGVAGGSWHDHYGSAVNHQCLPNNPVWGRYTDKSGSAFMYGLEFEESLIGLMDMSNVDKTLLNHNVPCAVCRSKKRTSSLMVPAKFDCFEGWHLEYRGYLMAGHHGSKSGTQYMCVDEAPEADPAGYRDEAGAVLYRVTAVCGSLPCPRYVQNRELSCAVCTK